MIKGFRLTVIMLSFIFSANFALAIENSVGIGMQLIKDKKKIYIMRVFPNTPAYKAGLPEGAEIISIDGQKVKNMTIGQVSAIVSGEAGTNVTLLIKNNRTKFEYNLTRQAYTVKPPVDDKNFSVHWKQVVPTQYENAEYITPYKQYSNNLLWTIEKNNYWVERREIFKTGYDACLSYPVKDRNACYMNLVNREIDRTLKEKQLQNQQEMIRQQMYQTMQIQNMYHYRHPYFWY